jgi:Fe-S cluster assembly protein SufD
MTVLDLEQLADVTLPTTDEEMWRYSRIAELDLSVFSRSTHQIDVVGGDDLVTIGGEIVDLFPDETADVFAEINRAGAEIIRIVVPAGLVVDEPIAITHTVFAGSLICPRLVIEVGANSEVTVIERFVSGDDAAALVLPVLQLQVDQAGRAKYLAVNELNDKTWSIGHQQAVGHRDSNSLLATVALGGDYARVRTEARLSGKGGSTRQVALYFAGGKQMHDFRTIQDHDAPHTTSDLLFKGAVQDDAASVYTGLIKIREHAGGTSAFQTNRNLTLSDGAWAESVPNLDIRTNDVKCSHASTIGPIDEEQRFYLESRGVRPEIAERLVVLGFFDEVLSQLPAQHLAESLRATVAAKLNLGNGSGSEVNHGN